MNNSIPTLFIPVGISGSGKSTLAKAMAETMGVSIVSSDQTRKALFGDESVQGNPALVFQIAHACTVTLLQQGKSVVFDATNTMSRFRKELLNKVAAENIACKKVAIVFDVNPERAIAQMAGRERKVPVDVIQRQWEQLKADFVNLKEEVDEIIVRR